MPVDNGRPVAFVKTPDDGVPSAGVINVGDVCNTLRPVPVEPPYTALTSAASAAVNADVPLAFTIPVIVPASPVPPHVTASGANDSDMLPEVVTGVPVTFMHPSLETIPIEVTVPEPGEPDGAAGGDLSTACAGSAANAANSNKTRRITVQPPA